MHRQIDLKSLLSEILKTVQKNGKNVMKKYFKIFSKKFSFRENTEAATPQFSSAKPNRNQSPGLFFDPAQCVHGPQCALLDIVGPAPNKVAPVCHIEPLQSCCPLGLPAQCQLSRHCNCCGLDNWMRRRATRVVRNSQIAKLCLFVQ